MILQIGDVSSRTDFNNVALLDGSTATIDIQTGSAAGEVVTVALTDVTAATLGVDTIDISTAAGASAALTALDTAMDTVTTAQASLGASQKPFAGDCIQSERSGS